MARSRGTVVDQTEHDENTTTTDTVDVTKTGDQTTDETVNTGDGDEQVDVGAAGQQNSQQADTDKTDEPSPTARVQQEDLTLSGSQAAEQAQADDTVLARREEPVEVEPVEDLGTSTTDPRQPAPAVTDAVTGSSGAAHVASSNLAVDAVTAPLGTDASALSDGVGDDHDYTLPVDNIARNAEQLAALVAKYGRENRHVIINEDTSNLDAQFLVADKFAVLFDIDYGNGPDRTRRITEDLYAAGIMPKDIEYYNSSLAAFKKFSNTDARYKSGVTQSQLNPTQDRAEAAQAGEATGDGVADGI